MLINKFLFYKNKKINYVRYDLELNKKKSRVVIFVDRKSHDVSNMKRAKENEK